MRAPVHPPPPVGAPPHRSPSPDHDTLDAAIGVARVLLAMGDVRA